MMTNEQQADRVWENTLAQIKVTRKRRHRMKCGIAAGAVCGWIAIWILFPSESFLSKPSIAIIPPMAIPSSNIAVMRVGDDGVIRLEECAPGELGSIELTFGLAPVVANDWEGQFP
jgi:hypothetical protein